MKHIRIVCLVIILICSGLVVVMWQSDNPPDYATINVLEGIVVIGEGDRVTYVSKTEIIVYAIDGERLIELESKPW